MDHDCCDPKNAQQQKLPRKRLNIDPFLMSIIVVTVLTLGGVIFLGVRMGSTAQVTTDNQVALSVESTNHDWGTIDINGGMAVNSFQIKNTTNSVLKLFDVKTSCTCTTAQLKTTNQTSPKYSMHQKGADVFEVNPGETAELIVEFDPLFHGPDAVGPINRTVTLSTNDANNAQLNFQLTANVVKK